MAPASVTDKIVVEKWTFMRDSRSRVRVVKVKFIVGHHVRICKEKNSQSGPNRIILKRYLES